MFIYKDHRATISVKCYPGTSVSNLKVKLYTLSNNDVSTLVVHIGTNDIKSQEYKVLKRNSFSMCVKAKQMIKI